MNILDLGKWICGFSALFRGVSCLKKNEVKDAIMLFGIAAILFSI